MIYTSYFAQMKKLIKNDLTPIAICGKSPDWYNGLEYKKLAPKLYFFKIWKETGDNAYYVKHYREDILDKLNPHNVVKELQELSNKDKDIVLLCYEKPDDFCHRHIVSLWLNCNNINCEEWRENNERNGIII